MSVDPQTSMGSETPFAPTPNGPKPVELVFLGTGTSSSIPHVECLTAPPEDKPCKTCISTLTPEGKKNIRRKTSCAFRMDGKDGQKVYVLLENFLIFFSLSMYSRCDWGCGIAYSLIHCAGRL